MKKLSFTLLAIFGCLCIAFSQGTISGVVLDAETKSPLEGGLLFIKKKKAVNNDDAEKPPKDAPQLNIQNPGTQDDFPKAARESDIG